MTAHTHTHTHTHIHHTHTLTHTHTHTHYIVAPSNPLNVAVVKTDSTTCKISWDPPTSDGGRSDVSYCIEYQSTSRLFRGYLPAGTVATGSPNMFTVEGLDPVTEYTLRLITNN